MIAYMKYSIRAENQNADIKSWMLLILNNIVLFDHLYASTGLGPECLL